MLTCPCNEHPGRTYFILGKAMLTGVYIFFLTKIDIPRDMKTSMKVSTLSQTNINHLNIMSPPSILLTRLFLSNY